MTLRTMGTRIARKRSMPNPRADLALVAATMRAASSRYGNHEQPAAGPGGGNQSSYEGGGQASAGSDANRDELRDDDIPF